MIPKQSSCWAILATWDSRARPDLVFAKLGADEEVLQKQSASLECGVAVEEDGVAGRLAVPVGEERAKPWGRVKSIARQGLFGDQ